MAILCCLLILVYLLYQKKQFVSFDRDNTNFLKAILPFFIILCHSFTKINEFRSLGVYVVALFFFVSGYGLECKKLNISKLEWGGVLLRYKKLLLPVMVPIVIYVSLVWLLRGVSFQWIVESLGNYSLILPHSWFVLSLCQLYAMYYISWAAFRKNSLMAFFVMLTAYICVLFFLRVQSTYYCSLYGFMAGTLFVHLIPKLKMNKKWQCFGIIGLTLTYVIIRIQPPMTALYNTCLFVVSAAVLLSAVITKGRVINFFSKISYEIYLCQGIGFLVARQFLNNNIAVFFCTVIISVIAAYICNKLTCVIIKNRLISEA